MTARLPAADPTLQAQILRDRKMALIRGSHLSNTTCLTQVSTVVQSLGCFFWVLDCRLAVNVPTTVAACSLYDNMESPQDRNKQITSNSNNYGESPGSRSAKTCA